MNRPTIVNRVRRAASGWAPLLTIFLGLVVQFSIPALIYIGSIGVGVVVGMQASALLSSDMAFFVALFLVTGAAGFVGMVLYSGSETHRRVRMAAAVLSTGDPDRADDD